MGRWGFDQCWLRLGPSASQLPIDDDKVSELVKAMSLLQTSMQQPWCKDLMVKLGFTAPDLSGGQELRDAQAGHPAPARPAGSTATAPTPAAPASTPATSSPGVDPAPAVVSADAKAPALPASAPATPAAPAEEVINSSTHRAAHARLARRMQALGEAECPNMVKLWSGSRKDGVLCLTYGFTMLHFLKFSQSSRAKPKVKFHPFT